MPIPKENRTMTSHERNALKRWQQEYGTAMDRDCPPPGGWLKYLKDGKREGTGVFSARYRRYTRSAQWRERRADAIARAGGRCDHCGEFANAFQVHHVTYQRAGAEWPEDLRALCVSCHGMLHDARRLPFVPPNATTKALMRARRSAPFVPPPAAEQPNVRRRPRPESTNAPAMTGALAEDVPKERTAPF
jgi:hypothetical protein